MNNNIKKVSNILEAFTYSVCLLNLATIFLGETTVFFSTLVGLFTGVYLSKYLCTEVIKRKE